MQCAHARELFSDYIEGATDRALAVTLQTHIASCAQCRDEVEALQRVWQTLDALPVEEPPAFFHENLMHRVLATEDAASREAAARPVWDWRALFRPRSLAFASA